MDWPIFFEFLITDPDDNQSINAVHIFIIYLKRASNDVQSDNFRSESSIKDLTFLWNIHELYTGAG